GRSALVARRPRPGAARGPRDVAAVRPGAGVRTDYRPPQTALRDRPRSGWTRHPVRDGVAQHRGGTARDEGRAGPGPGAAGSAAAREGPRGDGGVLRLDRAGVVPDRAALLSLRDPLRAAGLRLLPRPRGDG